jgi:hypothetical protein
VIQVTIRNKKQLARPEINLAAFSERIILIESESGNKQIAHVSRGSCNDHKILIFLRGTLVNNQLKWELTTCWQPMLDGKEKIFDISDSFTFGVDL